MAEIEDTLKELDRWYNELPGGTDRHKFLAKLATLELCGWLEHRLDSMIQKTGALVGVDPEWVTKNVINDNHGFTYQDHLRKMLSKLVGESGALRLEKIFDQSNPGKLDQLKGSLKILSKDRGLLAHTHTRAPVVQQQTINAPSWAINQQRVIGNMLDKLEDSIDVTFGQAIAKP